MPVRGTGKVYATRSARYWTGGGRPCLRYRWAWACREIWPCAQNPVTAVTVHVLELLVTASGSVVTFNKLQQKKTKAPSRKNIGGEKSG